MLWSTKLSSSGRKTQFYKCWKLRKVIRVIKVSIRGISHLHFPASLLQRWISLSGPRGFCLWSILGMFCGSKERVLSCFFWDFFFLPEPQRESREEHQCSFWVRTSNICERDSQPGGGGSLMYPPSLDISGCLKLPNRILASIHWCMWSN